jgi:cytochrome b involved in lipid metabolism
MPIALLIAMLLSGSVSYAAEGSLPGDTLYPIKIHVNENVKGALALSAEAKAEHEASLAEERLTEAEELARTERLSTSTREDLKDAFLEHRSHSRAHLDELDATTSAALRAEFDSRFDRHGRHRDAFTDLGVSIEGDESVDDHDDDRQDESGESRTRTDVSASTTVSSRREDHEQESGRKDDGLRIESESGVHLEIESDRHGRSSDDEGEREDDDDRGAIVPSIVSTVVAPTPSSQGTSVKTYTLSDIASHASASSCYSAISGNVYDLTSFISGHPGGSVILSVCGKDGTALFMAQHGGAGKPASVLSSLRIGVLAN